ncbi:hypothetical protein FKM82_030622 [Ascaphus truei]
MFYICLCLFLYFMVLGKEDWQTFLIILFKCCLYINLYYLYWFFFLLPNLHPRLGFVTYDEGGEPLHVGTLWGLCVPSPVLWHHDQRGCGLKD